MICIIKYLRNHKNLKSTDSFLIKSALLIFALYIIFLSCFIKWPKSKKGIYLYSCFVTKMIPLPSKGDLRCTDLFLFNLTEPLSPNRVTVFENSQNSQNSQRHLSRNSGFECDVSRPGEYLYYCLEYASINNNNLYFLYDKITRK